MHQELSDKLFEEYCQTGYLPAGIRPTICASENCTESSQFHRHSRYPRTCVYRQEHGWAPKLWVQRFRCAACDKVFTFFIPFVYKWQRAEHSLQQAVVLDQPYPKDEVAEAFSERTLKRWKQKWHARSGHYLQAIIQWLFTLYAFLSVNVTAQQARTPLSYLQALLDQLPGKAPVAVKVVSVCRFGGDSLRRLPHFLSLVFS